MARTNMTANRIKPQTSELLTLHVLRREQISPHFARVTLGDGDVTRFVAMGFDQWFRLFIPVTASALSRLPNKLNLSAYAKYLAISKAERPVLRNYSVRAYRPKGPQGPELDVDFVLHGAADGESAGPAAAWARTCSKGDAVAIIDEGVGFNPDPSLSDVLLVVDESGLPAVAGILDSLPADTRGQALIEVPTDADRQPLTAPDGVDVHWLTRGQHAAPGSLALAEARALPLPDTPCYGWVVGEQNLPGSLRGHWVQHGLPKQNIMFCGYWKQRTRRG